MSNRELIIKVNPRIHITLIGMNQGGYRINGGVGFAIENPFLKLRFTRSKVFGLYDQRNESFSSNETKRIDVIVSQTKRRLNLSSNINVDISGAMPTHFGFGSSTAVRLSCLEALHILNNKKPDRDKVVSFSGRGGTSGIGINTYFEGGFVIDVGRKADSSNHCPSHVAENRIKLPLLMHQIKMPKWEIGICIPKKINPKSEKEEKEFFKKACPLPAGKVYETLYDVIFGLYASAKENDSQAFGKAIRHIQRCAWKLAERREYGKSIPEIEKHLYNNGATAVGMSSLGPSLFFFADNTNDVIRKINQRKIGCSFLLSKPTNTGRNIIHV